MNAPAAQETTSCAADDGPVEQEWEVIVDALREQYRYLVDAPDAETAERLGRVLAGADGWNGWGSVTATEL